MNILDRDRTGKCVGECRDLALEGLKNRQTEIEADPFKAPDFFPAIAHTRNEQPGWLGGHV